MGLMLPGPALADRPATIRNIHPTPLQAPAGTSLADIGAAIREAAAIQRWEIVAETPGSVTARLKIRTHTATVWIQYDESFYQIDYIDSVNLDYSPNDLRMRKSGPAGGRLIKGPRIHNNYNVWVGKLSEAIRRSSKYPGRAPESPEASFVNNPMLIADELEKLDSLRKRGILTQEEFDLQKAKLLR